MAGGKETPRQKMIGMMYLVLTALLALNVSNAVLEKFAVLNTTLEDLRKEATKVNESTLAKILDSKSDKPSAIEARQKSQQVREETKKTIEALEKYKVELGKEHSGKEIPKEELILNTNIAEEKMLSSTKPKFGQEFEKILVDYSDKMKTITGLTDLPKLNKRASDYDEFKNNDHHKTKDFLNFQFAGTPTMAAITTITQFQNEVLETETLALEKLAALADTDVLKVDNFSPMVIAKSNIVAAGDKYVGNLFLAAAASGIEPEMYRNGAKLNITDDPKTKMKFGKIEFVATAPSYDALGQSKQTFKARIDVKGKPYETEIEYIVAKPVIRVTTGNAPQLYLNCGNTVNIEVPALGTNYSPTFTASGAQIVKGDKPSKVTIVPSQMKVSVTVTNGGANLGTEPFEVKRIPRPHVTSKDQNGRAIDMKAGLKIAGLNSCKVSVEPDDTFKENAPKDANYRVRSMEVNLKRGVQYVKTMNINSENIDLTAWKADLRPGDVLVCNIKNVTRKTFLGEDDRVDFNEYVLISLN
jgi:gliding motility-associated protein GldM